MSRLSRRDMKRDELVTTLSRLSMAVEEHTKSIIITIVAVVVLAGAVTAGVLYSRSQERAAQTVLSSVTRAATAQVSELHIIGSGTYPSTEEKYNAVLRLSDTLLETYPASQSAQWAIYWKGLGLMELGRGDEAREILETLDSSGEKGFVYWSAQFLKARILESQGRGDEAAGSYRELADSGPEQFPVELALMNLARLLEAQGKSEEALEVYQRVTRDYPESPFARTATLNVTRAGGDSF